MGFANGFVLEKRTHLEGVCGVVFIEKWVRFRKTKPLGDRKTGESLLREDATKAKLPVLLSFDGQGAKSSRLEPLPPTHI